MAKKAKYSEVVREGEFQDYGAVKADSKRRVVLKGPVHELYRVYRNASGQILLDPQVMIPAEDAWLFENKKALAMVRRGLKELGEGKFVKMPSLARHAEDEI